MAEPYWWLSFADGSLPKSQQFIGVIIGQGDTIEAVVKETHHLGVNPGGEIAFAQIPPEHVPPSYLHWKLLSYANLSEAGLLE